MEEDRSKRALREIEEVKLMQRTILAGLKDFFNFEKPMIEKVCCQDEVDCEILQRLYEAGAAGRLPKDFAADLSQYRIRRHQVSRRLERMNRRLLKELGERVAEKRGWRWAMTSFSFEVWGHQERIWLQYLPRRSIVYFLRYEVYASCIF